MVSGCFSDFILYDVLPPPFFVLCMCSFLTRSRGNAHSSSSSICSVNSLWVITSLLRCLNPPMTLLSSLLSCCQTSSHSGVIILSFFCVSDKNMTAPLCSHLLIELRVCFNLFISVLFSSWSTSVTSVCVCLTVCGRHSSVWEWFCSVTAPLL